MHYTAVFIYMQVIIFNKVSDIIGVKSFNGIAFRRRLAYTVFDYSEIFAPAVSSLPAIDSVTIATAVAERATAMTASLIM